MFPTHAARVRRLSRAIPPCALLTLALATGVRLGSLWTGRPVPASAQSPGPTPTATPLSPGGTQVLLPALGPLSGDPACGTTIQVQLVGDTPSGVTLIMWGEPGECPVDASAGPARVDCAGLLRPGGVWSFTPQRTVKSGALFSFNSRMSSDIIEDDINFEDYIAYIMCEELFFGVVGDAKDYRLFKQRFDTGGVFRGIPQNLAAGGPIAVRVERGCPDSGGTGDGPGASYSGVSGTAFGVVDRVDGHYAYGIASVAAVGGGRSSQVYVQNAGSTCASVEVWLHPLADPSNPDCGAAAMPCTPLTIAPGESIDFDVRKACSVADGISISGSLSLRSTGPLAVVADLPSAATGGGFAGIATDVLPDAELAAPLLVDTAGGWRARLHLRNAERGVAATGSATVRDAQGEAILTRDLSACPSGSVIWDVALPAGSASPFLGSVSVSSQVMTTSDGPVVPLLAGVIELARAGGGNRLDQSAAYALAHAGGAQPGTGQGAAGADVDVGAVVLPSLSKAAKSTDPTSAMVIANTAASAGSTDFAVLLFDKNGFVSHLCRSLGAREAQLLDLGDWPSLPAGFAGSGVVSATAWSHPISGAGGIHNAVGLSAVVIEPGPGAPSGFAGDTTAEQGLGLPPGQLTGFPGAEWPLIFVPGCPGASRLVSPTPEPTRTPRPTATPRPTPDLKVRGFLPLAFKARVPRR